jgi:hypothetical protein
MSYLIFANDGGEATQAGDCAERKGGTSRQAFFVPEKLFWMRAFGRIDFFM